MLKLKRVEIQGFKSFYDRTEMKFNGSGIAAVVGPNGCGKSNLSDAMSWVIGEQSAKTLRGTRMEDVIFAGTRDRKALGMASVTITLVPDQAALRALPKAETPSGAPDEADGQQETEPESEKDSRAVAREGASAPSGAPQSEITITRRLYRSGESEYLINGKTVRLRDIQDLFLGTGLGPESYAIIEQGRVGQILSNRPQDRRNVIEEAAGITKFKTRKRLAEAKLESAKQNLSRVFDILEEVTRQVNSLRRQAAKTKRYSELKGEATEYLKQLLSAKFRMLERETAKTAIELNLVSSELFNLQTTVLERETEQTQVLEQSYISEQELTQARKELAELRVEAERTKGRLEFQIKQIQQAEARQQAAEREAEAIANEQKRAAADLEQQTVALQALDAECTGAKQELEGKLAQRQESQQQLSEQERALEAARQRVIKILGESSGLKNRITQGESQLSSAERDAARAKAEEQQNASELTRIEQLRAQLSDRLAARQTELISVTDQRKAIDEELRQSRAKLNDIRQVLERVRGESSRLKARKDSLGEVIQHRSYTTETVKRLFTAVERGKANTLTPVGVLADFLEVDPDLEKATEEFLHDELEFVVVRDWSDAERGVELMRSELNGRATFLVESGAHEKTNPTEITEPITDGGIVHRLSDKLRLTNGLSGLSLSMLPRISNCYVTEDRAAAQRLAPTFPHCWFLTPDGVNYHGAAVSGGKKSGAGPLALKRELREVTQLEQAKQRELNELSEESGRIERQITKLTEHLEHLRTQQQAQEKDVLALDHESRKLSEDLQRVQSRLSHARIELERVGRDRVKVEERLAQDRQALAQAEQGRHEEERALEQKREELTLFRNKVAQIAEEHSALRAGLASLEERRRALAASRAKLETQTRDLANREAHLHHEAERLIAERTQLTASNAELEARRTELERLLVEADGKVSQLVTREAEYRTRLTEAEDALKRLRSEAQGFQEKRSELQVALARFESDLKHLEETCQAELGATLGQVAEGVEAVPDDAAREQLEAKYAEVKKKIDALGPVNPQAMEEFEESQQRQGFLNTQRQDLLDSIRDTEKAIQEIDGESRKRFAEAFHAINANFREMFKTLFGGGIGEMRLTDEENLAESGIEIVASPPGKKLQSVLLLSGGEKSLTAMALLMGIFQYTPSPFCILDEIDAPLDEANIERLTRLLKEMAEQTQFIVITHAKRTMEAAQSLYGVTMQEPGVSKLVSVKFKQDVRQAEPPKRIAAEELQMEVAAV